MPKIKPFELFSDAYDDWFIKNKNIYELEVKAIKEFIPANAFGLEVGIGTGKFAIPLGIKIGVEPSKAMATKAKKHGIKVYDAVAENLPFENNKFDFVLLVTTICFVDDIKKTFEEAHRVLKNNGSIIIGFIDKNSETGKKYIAKKNKSKFYNVATFYSTNDILNYLTNTGFTNFKIKQTILPNKEKNLIKDGYGDGSFVVISADKN